MNRQREPGDEGRVRIAAGLTSFGVSVVLLAAKYWAYLLTGSTAILSDALESIVNVVAALFALSALDLAGRPADRNHPYGHGKVEFLSAGIEGGMILVAAVVIAVKAVDTMLFHEVTVERLGLGLGMMAAAMVVNGGVGLYLVRVGRRKFLAPLYGALAATPEGKAWALRVYERARPGYHAVSRGTIDGILGWEEGAAATAAVAQAQAS